ncbi:MAG: hypothetical protein IPO48_19215 [Saprospiraceae bacterium]|nr:hypothetical protein [Saprospiraceae bacterium]
MKYWNTDYCNTVVSIRMRNGSIKAEKWRLPWANDMEGTTITFSKRIAPEYPGIDLDYR